MQAEFVLFIRCCTPLNMLPIYLYPDSVYVKRRSMYKLCHICFCLMSSESEGLLRSPSLTLLLYLMTSKLNSMLNRNFCQPFPTPGPPGRGSCFIFGAPHVFLYGCESSGCILLCFIVHSSVSFSIIIGVASHLKAEILFQSLFPTSRGWCHY